MFCKVKYSVKTLLICNIIHKFKNKFILGFAIKVMFSISLVQYAMTKFFGHCGKLFVFQLQKCHIGIAVDTHLETKSRTEMFMLCVFNMWHYHYLELLQGLWNFIEYVFRIIQLVMDIMNDVFIQINLTGMRKSTVSDIHIFLINYHPKRDKKKETKAQMPTLLWFLIQYLQIFCVKK